MKNIEKIAMLFWSINHSFSKFAYSLSMIYNFKFILEVWKCKEMWRDFSKIARTSKMIVISKSKTTDKNCIEQLMRKYNAEYLIVVKSNKTFNSKFCYPKYFIMDSDALNEL